MNRKKELKKLDAIGFDELDEFLGETIHTAFRKGCNDGHQIWSAMRDLDRQEWSAAIAWMVWALRVSTDRENS